MKPYQKYLSAGVLALLTQAAFAQTAPVLGRAANFTVLGNVAVTCTDSTIIGDVGISNGNTAAFVNTRCTILGGTPPATNAAAVGARADFLSAYAAIQALTPTPCTTANAMTGTLAGISLAPGTYCLSAEAKTGVLTLTGDGPWIFRVAGALTGTNFTVNMAAGNAKACNVFWAPSAGATFTTSAVKGNILAGDIAGVAPQDGSITLTGGSLIGRALASVAVTMTGTTITGCAAASGALVCKVVEPPKPHDDDDDDDGDKDDDDDDDDRNHGKKKGHGKHPFGKKDKDDDD